MLGLTGEDALFVALLAENGFAESRVVVITEWGLLGEGTCNIALFILI